MHVLFLIMSVVFFCIAFDHLFITNSQRDRGTNGFLLAVMLNAIFREVGVLLS